MYTLILERHNCRSFLNPRNSQTDSRTEYHTVQDAVTAAQDFFKLGVPFLPATGDAVFVTEIKDNGQHGANAARVSQSMTMLFA